MIEKGYKIGFLSTLKVFTFGGVEGFLKALFLVWAMVIAICDLREVIG
jgi:hypothetical protein